MSFQMIPGQERVKRVLQNGLAQNKLSHAYIFHGPLGTGRKRTALALAKAVYCSEMQDDACGQCLECRKVEHRNHPDLHWIEPDGASIKIDQIRELQKQLSYRSTSASTKIYIMNHAERMTVQAANGLLKFLEDPVSPVIAILISDNGHALLPTIKSRAQWLAFTPLDADTMRRTLEAEGFSKELILPSVKIAAGLDAARKLIQGNWFAETRNVVIQLGKECLAHPQTLLVSVHQKVMKTEVADHLDTLFDLFILWFKDMIHARYNRVEQIVYIDQQDWLKKNAFSREEKEWVTCMEQAVEMQKRLRFHANPQLTLEKFVIYVQGG